MTVGRRSRIPFPRLLKLALLLPYALVAISVAMFAFAGRTIADNNTHNYLKVAFFLVAAITELIAVAAAIFLMVRSSYYATFVNLLITLAAALPFAFLVIIVVFLNYGHYHI